MLGCKCHINKANSLQSNLQNATRSAGRLSMAQHHTLLAFFSLFSSTPQRDEPCNACSQINHIALQGFSFLFRRLKQRSSPHTPTPLRLRSLARSLCELKDEHDESSGGEREQGLMGKRGGER